MQVQQEENRDGGEVVEAQLRLDEGDVISGEIVGAGGDAWPRWPQCTAMAPSKAFARRRELIAGA